MKPPATAESLPTLCTGFSLFILDLSLFRLLLLGLLLQVVDIGPQAESRNWSKASFHIYRTFEVKTALGC